jgi:hypothetical protein
VWRRPDGFAYTDAIFLIARLLSDQIQEDTKKFTFRRYFLLTATAVGSCAACRQCCGVIDRYDLFVSKTPPLRTFFRSFESTKHQPDQRTQWRVSGHAIAGGPQQIKYNYKNGDFR